MKNCDTRCMRKQITTQPRRWNHKTFCIHFLAFFQHMVFVDSFLIPVKELGLLTNLSQWIRGLDAMGSYMYILL
jgi:hypothetical protein